MDWVRSRELSTRQVGLIGAGFLVLGEESMYLPWLWIGAPAFAIACLPIAMRAKTGRPKAGWMLIAAGIGCWLVADAYYPLVFELTGEWPGVPSVADGSYFVGYALLTVGMVFALELAAPARNARWMLDATIVIVGGAGLLYYFVLAPIIQSPDGLLATIVGVGYPSWDLVMLAVLIVAAYSARASIDKPAALLCLAVAILIASDAVYASWAAKGSFSYPVYLDLGWLASYFAFAGAFVAAGQQREHFVSETLSRRLRRAGTLIPYAFLLPVIGVAIYHAVQQDMDSGLVISAASLVGLVLLRQLAAMRENSRLVEELSAEDALRQRLMEAQSTMGQGIAVLQDGRIRSANGAVQAIVGRSEGDLQSIGNLAALMPLSMWRRHGVPRAASGHIETAIRQPDGTIVEVEVSWAQFSASPNRTVLVMRDLRERREAEAATLRAEKARSLGMLAGGVAHDMNNMLTAVTGNAGLALLVAGEESPAAPFLDDIQTAAGRASELANSLLAYAGRDKVTRQPTDLNLLVTETVRLARSRISTDIALEVMLDPALPTVVGNDSALRQVVMNLVVNAADALDGHAGQVLVLTGPGEDGRAVLEVRDTGPGMTAETKRRLFDPFFTTKPKGKGLGLPTVIGVVRSHQGEIVVDSEPGAGTSFKVMLPTTAEPPATAPCAALREHWQTPGLAIVADDDPAVRSVTVRVLESCGMDVLAAKDGAEAVELAFAHPSARCLVLDVDMPRMTGPQAWEVIRELRPEMPVLFVSGYDARDDAMKQLAPGQVVFLPKPYRVDDMVSVLRDLLQPMALPLAG